MPRWVGVHSGTATVPVWFRTLTLLQQNLQQNLGIEKEEIIIEIFENRERRNILLGMQNFEKYSQKSKQTSLTAYRNKVFKQT